MTELAPFTQLNTVTDAHIARFRAIVGAEHALTDPDQQLPYLREWRDVYFGKTPVVLRPKSTAEVAAILALCNAERLAVVPQAGNTGLVGAQIPFEAGREVVVTVERMTAVREVDAAGYAMTVEAGLTLLEAQKIADAADRLFPLSLPSEGSCRIGGNIGSNAGGVGVLAYGNTRSLVLGLEAVMADGRIYEGLKSLKKDNSGYDLRDLFIGSEGTLGIVTAAVLKLFPRPAERSTALVALDRLGDALTLFSVAQQTAGRSLTAFEFIPRICIEFVTRHVAGARDAFPTTHPWYALLEISGSKADETSSREMQDILEAAMTTGLITDAVLAGSLAQARDLWRLREGISEAQKPEGGNLKHDVSVPITRIAEFIHKANALVARIAPGARPIPLGHFGDGNVHYNVSQPVGSDRAAFMALSPAIAEAVHDLALGMNGSISAEHGIGRARRDELRRTKPALDLELMRGIKRVFDPNGILNPGKML